VGGGQISLTSFLICSSDHGRFASSPTDPNSYASFSVPAPSVCSERKGLIVQATAKIDATGVPKGRRGSVFVGTVTRRYFPMGWGVRCD
jgi:hypothetical protein